MALDAAGRWLRHSASGRWLGALLAAGYIRLVGLTMRRQRLGLEHRDAMLASGAGFVTVIWHGRLFITAIVKPRHRRIVAMISNNRDGDVIAAVLRRFDVFAVRGSTYDHEKRRDKGGRGAYADAVREVCERDAVVVITPDGPRGPRMRAQRGAAVLAIQTGRAVLPMAFSTTRGKILKSWDRFLLPWPFARAVEIYGAPIAPPAPGDGAGADAFLAELEASLTAITVKADALCGREPVAPGPARA